MIPYQLQTFNSENNNHFFGDAIFSPYLNKNKGIIVGESSPKLNPFMSNRKSPLHPVEKSKESGEIGVFGAEKYFNGGEVIGTPRPKHQLNPRGEPISLEPRMYRVEYGTPSTRSESTCNSQSALLHGGMRNSRRNSKGKSVLAGLRLKCSCSDKNSVDIRSHVGEISFNKTSTYGVNHGSKTPPKLFNVNAGLEANHSVRICKPNAELFTNKGDYFQKQEMLGLGLNRPKNSFSFSTTVNSSLGNHLVKMQLQLEEEEGETPRKSLEVFGSPILNNKNKSLSIDRRSEIDANYYNDAGSNASSELFELESLKEKSNPFLARQESDAADSGCYEPSEASIEWSVVTASAAVMSDCDEEQMSEVTIRSPIRALFTSSNGKTRANSREILTRGPSLLLGCKSHKAVSVAGDAFITLEKPSSTPKTGNRTNTPRSSKYFLSKPQVTSAEKIMFESGRRTTMDGKAHGSKLLYI